MNKQERLNNWKAKLDEVYEAAQNDIIRMGLDKDEELLFSISVTVLDATQSDGEEARIHAQVGFNDKSKVSEFLEW